MEPVLYCVGVLQVAIACWVWAIWWRRGGKARLILCLASSLWILVGWGVMIRSGSPVWPTLLDTLFMASLALALELQTSRVSHRPEAAEKSPGQAPEEGAEIGRYLVRILEATPDLVAIYDPRGAIIYANQAARHRVIGDDDAHGTRVIDRHKPEDQQRIRDEVLPALEKYGLWVGDLDILDNTGQPLPTRQVVLAHRSPAGEIEMYSTFAHDITERLAVEEALRTSEAKFAAAFRHSLDAVMLTAMPSGELLDVNRGFTLITGFESAEAVGKTAVELGLWADLEDRKRMMDILRRDQRVHEMAANFRRVDNGIVHGLLWGELVDIRGGKCLLTVVRDITEASRQEAQRAALIEELERKNEELESFAYTVAHDLRNPLQSIQGFVELAQEDIRNSRFSVVKSHLERILGGAERLQELLESLLELSRAGRVIEEPKPVDLSRLVADALELLSASVAKSGADIKIAEDLPRVMGDRTRLLQVVQNLLSNALSCLGAQPEPRIEVGIRRGAELVVFVRDNGHGIPESHLESIFTLFERGESRREGTGSGIGLALVRRILEVHGGRVWAESEGLGQGSTFCFVLDEAP